MLTTLPEILSRYVAAFPAVQLQLHESFTARVIEGLLGGDVDAGIVRDAEPVDGLVATPMLSEPFVAVLPSDHPHAGDRSMSVAELADTPFVYPPRHAGPRAFEKPLALCEEHGFRPRIAHEASHWLTILRLVGAGLGCRSRPPACATSRPRTSRASRCARRRWSASSSSCTESASTGRWSTRSVRSRPGGPDSAACPADEHRGSRHRTGPISVTGANMAA